jgi:hypothetical protein
MRKRFYGDDDDRHKHLHRARSRPDPKSERMRRISNPHFPGPELGTNSSSPPAAPCVISMATKRCFLVMNIGNSIDPAMNTDRVLRSNRW